ncbi:hypothetical protein GRF29_164g449231 [Pseudopithomyces chartarum]|uniref:inorganic diphosphatase n=1 Tax=Pseudopithomyces chartarum TaxID=1892770 RepID=A0AAN6LT19_9PLEO|nr:hypothetical protein GRF29_164g449231 [Pseudopithomyces chartarum]
MIAKPVIASFAVLVVAAANPSHTREARKASPKPDKSCAEFDYDALSLREVGQRNTLDWRMYLLHRNEPISFWHDVPLYPDPENKQIVNFVVEIPRWTDGKIETRRPEALNPIFHDEKNGAPRFVESVWPHKSYPFLYGSIPQTWENPNLNHSFTGFPGDKDPMDLFDIGRDDGYTGQIKKVKLLGGLAVNDGDETDWKMLGIDIKDPLAALVNTYEDVEKYRPGTIQAFRDWFTYYKVARGDEIIPIIGETYQSVSFIVDTVEESHRYWQDLVSGKEDPGKIAIAQTSQVILSSWVPCKSARKELVIPKKASKPQEPAAKPERYHWWYYLNAERELVQVP